MFARITTRPRAGRFILMTVGLAATTCGACGQWGSDWGVEQSGPAPITFGTGYQDGFDAALESWSDYHAGWTWLWTKPETYRKEYDRGWADGRNVRRMQDRAKRRQR